jgi:hypothetical protein
MKDFLILIGVAVLVTVGVFVNNPGITQEEVDRYSTDATMLIGDSYSEKFNFIVEECSCAGKGYIEHGDGHRTPCPCLDTAGGCNCKNNSGDKYEP